MKTDHRENPLKPPKGTATKKRFVRMNRPPEDTSWGWLTAEMMDSPAWRALTGNAVKVVLRVLLEHLRHGGVENGNLPVTYSDFVAYGVRRNSVRVALAIAIALGFLDKTSSGEVPWDGGDIRKPSTYGLTWLPQLNGASASNRWTLIKTVSDAKTAIKRAKTEIAILRRFFSRKGKQTPTPKDVTCPSNEFDTSPNSDSVLRTCNSSHSASNDSGTPLYISGYPGGDAAAITAVPGRHPVQSAGVPQSITDSVGIPNSDGEASSSSEDDCRRRAREAAR